MGELLNALNDKNVVLINAKRAELNLIIEAEEQAKAEKTAFGIYSGRKFFSLNLVRRKWLVEGLIRERDSVIFVGKEKSGKSLYLKQLVCSLTSQHPFIDKHEIPKACKVTQVLLEGDLADTKHRYERMRQTIEFNEDNFQLYFSQPLELQTREGTYELIDKIAEFSPDVLIIDPVGFAFEGDLSDNKVVRQFIGNLRIIQDTIRCAVILVHHTHKDRNTVQGKLIDEGDEAIFGSKYFKAWPDHTILFTYNTKKEVRSISCKTQRSGDIIKGENYILRGIGDEPLYYEEMTEVPTKTDVLFKYFCNPLNKDGAVFTDITKEIGFSKTTFYSSIKALLRDGVVIKNDARPVVYKLNPEKKNLGYK